MISFDQERPEDLAAIESLLDSAFGPDRFNKASYKLRENNPILSRFSYVARDNDRIIGTVRYSRIQVCDLLSGESINAVFLGPLAIAADRKDEGIGTQLLSRTLAVLSGTGHHRVLLVGDMSYYGRFNFLPVLPSYITLPGGHDARRLLVRQPATLPGLPAVGKLKAGWSDAYSQADPADRLLMPAA